MRPPFFFSGINTSLDGLLQGQAEQVAALVEGVALAGMENLAGGGSLGKGVHLGHEGDGALDGHALLLATILEGNRRHRMVSLWGWANAPSHS